MRPVAHTAALPIPKPPNYVTLDEVKSDAVELHPDKVGERNDSDPTFE
jgi:hypothetical protein